MSIAEYRDYLGRYLHEHVGIVATAAAVAASASFMWLTAPKPIPLEGTINLEQQSVEIEPGVRASVFAPDGKFTEYFYEDATTTYEAFLRGIRVSNNGPCLGTRSGPNLEYVWQSYQEVHDKAQRLGSALIARGLQTGKDNFVGIYAANRPEWVMTDLGLAMYSVGYIPLYDTLGTEACSYIINQTSMSTVICDGTKKAEMMLSQASSTPSLKCVVVMDGVDPDLSAKAQAAGVELCSFQQLLDEGKKNLKEPIPPAPSDIATICFTSGTTGNPKGVILKHQAMAADAASIIFCIGGKLVNSSDIHISYLPLAHMFERLVHLMMVQHGGQIGFSRGDVRLLTEDLQALRPTVFPTVPRLLNRIYDKVLMGVSGSKVKSALFNLAFNRKMALLKSGVITSNSIWDKLVFNKVQKLLGGRLRICIVGSAPLSARVLDFTRAAFGCIVMEGYGQTEAVAGVCLTLPNEYVAGQVGPPLPCCHIKLVDVPEMDYYAKDNKGEVCARGACLMSGYYKDEEKTREAIDQDGWLHTGDIGQWTQNGTLKIIDRRKHIFKLAQGEYLAPEKIEGIYMRCSLVAQAFVDGNSLQVFPVAVIVPDPEVLPAWAKKQGISGSMAELCRNEVVKKAILDDITAEGKKAGLKGFEQVKRIFLFPELFSVENDFLTPTFKSKRPSLRKFFSQHIDDMYNEN